MRVYLVGLTCKYLERQLARIFAVILTTDNVIGKVETAVPIQAHFHYDYIEKTDLYDHDCHLPYVFITIKYTT